MPNFFMDYNDPWHSNAGYSHVLYIFVLGTDTIICYYPKCTHTSTCNPWTWGPEYCSRKTFLMPHKNYWLSGKLQFGKIFIYCQVNLLLMMSSESPKLMSILHTSSKPITLKKISDFSNVALTTTSVFNTVYEIGKGSHCEVTCRFILGFCSKIHNFWRLW